jgi:hypothetical protein
MKFEIRHRWNGEVLFAVEAESVRLAIEAAIKSKADLSKADLSEANLSEANLSKADLSEADLSEANPRSLRHIKHDIWGVLLHALPEVPALRKAIEEGKIDGSVYEGECACLCGTIANAKHCSVNDLGIADSTSMAERFFLAIKKGDTPKTNPASKLVLQWVDEFLALTGHQK